MKKGFTLIELMVVVVIMSSLAMLAIPTLTKNSKRYRDHYDQHVLTPRMECPDCPLTMDQRTAASEEWLAKYEAKKAKQRAVAPIVEEPIAKIKTKKYVPVVVPEPAVEEPKKFDTEFDDFFNERYE